MSKKTTLKHMQPNGEIATRQTARAYTHVLLCKQSRAALIAAHDAARDGELARVAKDIAHTFKRYKEALATEVGAPYAYDRNQGGYRKFADGSLATYPLPDYMHKLANEFFAKYGDKLEDVVAFHVAEAVARLDRERGRLAERSEEWSVISWHGSAKNAKPAYVAPGDLFQVEAINNGVRS